MLSKQQYEQLAPYAGLIKLAADSRSVASTVPYEAMANVHYARGGAPLNGYCGGCVLELYTTMARLIREYELNINQ